MFKSPKKPKVVQPAKTSDLPVQEATAELEKKRAMAYSQTVLTNQSGYGNVGNV